MSNNAVSFGWIMQPALFFTPEGVDPQELDKIVSDAGAAPMGPFYLSDLLGLDTVLHVAEHLSERYGERFHVSSKLRELVAAGDLGQKTGKGFYDHSG